MRSLITGSGIGLPPHVVKNDALAKIMDTSDEWIRTRSGIEQRYYAADGQGSTELGVLAAENALRDAGRTKEEIDAVIFATMTPDHLLPGNGPLLQDRMGLRTDIPTFDIRQQCSGFLYGLDLADSLIRSNKYSRVLLIGAEVHTPFMPWSKGWATTIGEQREVTEEEKALNTSIRDRTVLFGDAGAAVVVEEIADELRGVLATKLFTNGAGWDALCMKGAGFTRRPFVSHEQIDAGDTIPTMEGREVFRQAVSKMPDAVKQVCAEANVNVEELDLLLIHQANLRIIEGVQKALGLPPERVPHNIEKYGNTTAATLPLLYHDCRERGLIEPGKLIAFTALGSGLHWGATLYRA